MPTRLPKTIQVPALVAGRHLTDLDLQILGLIERYRFSPTSLLQSLLPANNRVISRRLQYLYHRRLVNRFAFRIRGKLQEDNYYIDKPATLRLLQEEANHKPDNLHFSWVESNREAGYADVARSNDSPDSLRFLKHEIDVGRFLAVLDWGCHHSHGQVRLTDWRRGRGELRSYFHLPKVTSRGLGGEREWREHEETERQPIEPDLFFELYYPRLPKGQQYGYFLYERERGSNNAVKYSLRCRRYFHWIAKQKKHADAYGVPQIHAVLTETETPSWREKLTEAARHPIVSREPSGLFLFTDSTLLTEPRTHPKVARFITEPTRIFEEIWYTPTGQKPISLLEQ